jgi:LSD1 subclass zinc finger protein
LVSHWQGTHIPDQVLQQPTKSEAFAIFEAYEQAIRGGAGSCSDFGVQYVRSYQPEKRAIVWFVAAYLLLRNGERTKAAQHFSDLTKLYPDFPDPWIWLSATTDDQARRLDHLENAVILEPAHPLARDALAIAQGKVSLEKVSQEPGRRSQAKLANCPRCGGALHYGPGTTAVRCAYCDHRLELQRTNLIDGEATLLGDLQLQRRLQGQTWKEVQRVVHCQACGAHLTMTHYLAKQCVFCGSTSVLAEDCQQAFEQPDGFLPFGLDENQATTAIGKAQRSTPQRLKSWWSGQKQEIGRLHAVYLPFWVFDGFVEVRAPVVRGSERGAPGDRPTTAWEAAMARGLADSSSRRGRLDRPPLTGSAALGKQLMMFDNLVYSAMDFPPAWLLKQLLPYRLRAVVPYEPRLLANWPAALYHRDVEVVVQEAYNLMLAKAVWRKRSLMLAQASDYAELRRTFQVTTVTYQLILLPVWVALARREREQRLVLVNGQTGRVVFSSPLSNKA